MVIGDALNQRTGAGSTTDQGGGGGWSGVMARNGTHHQRVDFASRISEMMQGTVNLGGALRRADLNSFTISVSLMYAGDPDETIEMALECGVGGCRWSDDFNSFTPFGEMIDKAEAHLAEAHAPS